jgi:hypothetical protein
VATAQPELDVLPRGIAVDAQALGPWLANVYERKQAIEVRPGFGQLAQDDSTLTLRDPIYLGSRTAEPFGYTKVLGTFTFRTLFGHTHVCTVLVGAGYTGSGWNGPLRPDDQLISTGAAQTFCCMSVQDVTAGTVQEHVLHRHTAENSAEASTPQDWRGLWQTFNTQDFGAVYRGSNRRVWFCEFRDTLLFGSPEIGTWAYRPGAPAANRRQWVETQNDAANVTGYSESPEVFPLVGAEGSFSEQYAYLPAANWPRFVDAAVVGNRVAFADDSNVYFSDPGVPNAVMGLNVFAVGSDRLVTALGSVLGQLLIFTDSETMSFQPTDTAVVSGGRKVKLSDSIGCLGPQARVRAEEALVWVDSHGVRRTTGNLEIETISQQIDPLFTDALQNPLTYWFQTQLVGYTPADTPHIHNVYDWRDTADVCMAYESVHGLLFILVPAYNIAMVKQAGGWKLWTWDTLVTATARNTTVTRNVAAQAITAFDGEVYLTHGVEVLTPTDAARTGGTVDRDENQAYGSYALLQWRRGGALDRSVEDTEDGRLGGGWYAADRQVTANDGAVYLGMPVPVPPGYILPQGTAMPNGGLLYPVVLRSTTVAANAPPDTVRVTINFDDTNWEAKTFGGPSQIDVLFPPTRHPSRIGWGYTAPAAGFREIQLYGNQIRMFFFGSDGAIPPGIWGSQPFLNTSPGVDQVLFWLPFEPTTTDTTMSLGVEFPVAASQTRSPAAAVQLTCFWYAQPFQLPLQTSDAVAQAVDWAVKTAQLGLESATQTRARGLYLRARARGAAASPIVSSWLYSQLNALVSSDWKDWSAQIVDYPTQNPSQQNSEQPRVPGLRSRVFDALSSSMVGRVFGGAATWGESGTPATGNFLVDDDQVDTLAVSSGVKGEHVSWLLFGNMLNRAEALSLSSLRAILQPRGQRRRTGRA